MPQLAVETYCSQIFWVLLGFAVLYSFVSCVITPGIEKGLENRALYLDRLVENTKKYDSEAGKLVRDSLIALENAEIESANSESVLIASFRERSLAEKNTLYHDFSQKAKAESSAFAASSDVAFLEISQDIDVIVSVAMKNLNSPSAEDIGR